MKKLITITAFQLLICHAFSQTNKLDSLLTHLPQATGEDRVLLLHEIVKAAWTHDPESVVIYGREAIDLSLQMEDLELLSASYRIFGGLYNYMSEIDSGKHYKLKALQIAIQLQDSTLLASSYNNLGVTAQTLGNYVEALNYYYQSYLIGRQLNGYGGLPVIIANLSEVYYDLNEYDSAVQYAKSAVAITSRQPNTSRHLLTLNALARSKLARNEFEEAKGLYESIIAISNEIGDKRYAAYANQGLGKLNTSVGNQEVGRNYFSKAMALFVELDDQAYISEIYIDLSRLKLVSEPDSAYFFTRKSMEIAKELGLKDLLIDDYQLLIALFSTQRNVDSLRYYQAIYQDIQQVRRKENNLISIQGMFAKLKDEQMRRQINNQKLALEQKTYQNNITVAFTVLITLFSGLIYRYYRKQKRLGNYLSLVNKQVTKQNEQIDNKNKKLSALNDEKNDLIKIVAHDLKNPLMNIVSAVQLIREDALPQNDVPLEIVETSAMRLSNMVVKILDVESIEKGLSNLHLVSVNVSEILAGIVDEYENQALKKQLTIHRDMMNDVYALGDKTYIYQVMENIFTNAIKYSPLGKNIFVVLKSYNRNARLEIKDEGPGISEKDQKQLFQMYQKLSSTPTANEHSSGIGLSIAKKYVDAMQGKIWCRSKLDQGTSFFVQLKLA